MREPSDELLLIWLNPRIERITAFSARHRLLTDIGLALLTALVSVVGLVVQRAAHPQQLIFCAALSATLLLRHRSSFGAFAAVAAVALVQWIWSVPQFADVSVLIGLYWVVLDGDLRQMLAGIAISELGTVMVASGWQHNQALEYWVAATGLVVAAAALGIMVRQRRVLLQSLQEKAARLELERDQQGQLGAAAERSRIAREMHDIVAHNLTVMIALADGAGYALRSSPDRAQAAIERVSATGRQALVEMRRLLGVLRDDSSAEPLEPQPGLERLDELIARVDDAGIPVTIDVEGEPHELAPGVQLAVFRVAQEALTNTLKHASRPTTAHLALKCEHGQVDLDVTNTGDPARSIGAARSVMTADTADGRGLRGMRERATAYGGDLEVGPTGDGGWRVHLHLTPELSGGRG